MCCSEKVINARLVKGTLLHHTIVTLIIFLEHDVLVCFSFFELFIMITHQSSFLPAFGNQSINQSQNYHQLFI